METIANLEQRLILVVDDEATMRRCLATTLEEQGYRVITAESGEEAISTLQGHNPDLILLDINMPGIDGLETLARVRRREDYISVIFITGRSDPKDIIYGLDAGADDYICTPFDVNVMLARVRTQLRIKDLNDRLAIANKKLVELVDTDDLTGLFNMRSIYQKLEKEIYRARRYGRGVCAVMMDIDNFKSVNDTYDHLFGSFVLVTVGDLVRVTIRQVDMAARYGGDEFLIILTETSQEGGLSFSERIRAQIADTLFTKDGFSTRVTASLGVAYTDGSEASPDARALVRQADHALYEAKRSGKNCVRVHQLPGELPVVVEPAVKPKRKRS